MQNLIDQTHAIMDASAQRHADTVKTYYVRAYYAAKAADDAWQAELERTYGPAAGDARYDARGTATENLFLLWLEWKGAEDERREWTRKLVALPRNAVIGQPSATS